MSVNVSDPIADMIARIRNGLMRGLASVNAPKSKICEAVLKVLQEEGFLNAYTADEAQLHIDLRYSKDRQPVIREIKRVSKPGRRVYAAASKIPVVFGGLGIAIVSTSKGVVSDNNARKLNVGGEVLCYVF